MSKLLLENKQFRTVSVSCGIPALSAMVRWVVFFSVAWKEYIFSITTFLSSEPLGNTFRTFGGCEIWGCNGPTICTGDAAEEKVR